MMVFINLYKKFFHNFLHIVKSYAVIFIVICLFILCISPKVYAEDVEFPLVQSITYFPYMSYQVLQKDEYTFSWNLLYANVFMFDPDRISVNDMEMAGQVFTFRYGLSRLFTAELYCRINIIYSGILDGIIENFHEFFGISQGGRHEYARYKVNYKYKSYFLYEQAQAAILPPVFSILGNLIRANGLLLQSRLAFGLPLWSKPGLSTDKAFFTAGLLLSFNKSDFSASFSIYFSFFKTPEWMQGEDLKNRISLTGIKLKYKSIFAGLFYRSSPFKEGDLANRAMQIMLGVDIGNYFTLYILEEVPPMDTISDFTIGIRLKILGNGKGSIINVKD